MLFERTVLRRHSALYEYCANCDYIFIANPFWLEEAYSDAIAASDTDIAARNIFTAIRLAAMLYYGLNMRGNGQFTDIAGGSGLLTRLMRDFGFDFYWSDLYATNMFARGFEYDQILGKCEAITAIEVLEHTPNPREFIRENLVRHQCDTLVFTTEVFADGQPPLPDAWSYYAFDTGQHISFFSPTGLGRLAQGLGMHYIRCGRLHVFTRKSLGTSRLSIAGHRVLAPLLALIAVRRLGSKRNADQRLLLKRGTGKSL